MKSPKMDGIDGYSHPEDCRKEIVRLEARVRWLETALEKADCFCTIADRLSGHIIGCPIPEMKQTLEGDE
ncbi:MAG TPA: hypothetical protein VJ044_11725 [Candidatus Hodarchaeales archaeon]|nr:hypothetical protein [Candidatus Hodarchaeales archaeon]